MLRIADKRRFGFYGKKQQNLNKIIKAKLYGEKTISFQGRNCWNKLPSDIKEINSVNLFKKKLKQHIISNY